MRIAIALFCVGLGCLPAAFAGSLDLSTGLDSGGSLIATDLGCDAHWSQTAGPTAACASSAAQVVMPRDADWWAGWPADGPNSNWITSNASTTANGSPVPTYAVRFYLADTLKAVFSGSWTIDDQGTISLNGNQIGSLSSGNWGTLYAVAANSASYLAAGWNTLSISMTSSDNSFEAVRFEGSVTGDGASFSAPTAVPEPASALLLLIGVAGLALRRRFCC